MRETGNSDGKQSSYIAEAEVFQSDAGMTAYTEIALHYSSFLQVVKGGSLVYHNLTPQPFNIQGPFERAGTISIHWEGCVNGPVC